MFWRACISTLAQIEYSAFSDKFDVFQIFIAKLGVYSAYTQPSNNLIMFR